MEGVCLFFVPSVLMCLLNPTNLGVLGVVTTLFPNLMMLLA